MKDKLPPIPTPPAQRWREFKIRGLPIVTLMLTLLAVMLLWREYVVPSTLIGAVESAQADVVSPNSGVLTNLWVTRFQEVEAGDAVAELIITDPSTVLQMVRTRADLAQIDMNLSLDQQRNAFDYQRLRLELLEQRVRLATAKVNLELAENNLERNRQLFENQLLSAEEYDLSLLTAQTVAAEVEQRSELIAQMESAMDELKQLAHVAPGVQPQSTNAITSLADEQQRLAQLALKPIVLRAPLSGKVSVIHRRPGENIVAGEPIITVTASDSERIVGYLRQPLPLEPHVGMAVQVRQRSGARQESWANILAIGNHFENINSNLLRPGMPFEIGLPISISLPPDLTLIPGELVELTLRPEKR